MEEWVVSANSSETESEPDESLPPPPPQDCIWKSRIYQDYQDFKKFGSPWGISAQIMGDDFGLWAVQILGPKDTPYEGGCFQGILKFSDLYPFSPPTFSFISNVFHPNVAKDGTVCLEQLYKNWSPCHTVWSLLVSVQFLLLDANVDEPLNTVASLYYSTNRKAFYDIVKQCVKASWEDLKTEGNSFFNLVDEKGDTFLQLDEFADYFQKSFSESETEKWDGMLEMEGMLPEQGETEKSNAVPVLEMEMLPEQGEGEKCVVMLEMEANLPEQGETENKCNEILDMEAILTEQDVLGFQEQDGWSAKANSSNTESEPVESLPPRKRNCTRLWTSRICRDYEDFQKFGNPWGISAQIMKDNAALWAIQILGPKDTPYEGGCFQGILQFSQLYPYSPPTFSFVSNVFHPNVSEDGTVCLEQLYKKWSPCHSVWSLLISVQFLLLDANVNEPLNTTAAFFYATNRKAFEDIVKQCVKASWEDLKNETNSFANLVDENGDRLVQSEEFSNYFQKSCFEAEKCNACTEFIDIPNWKDRLRYRMLNGF